jgi:hypothetical protein
MRNENRKTLLIMLSCNLGPLRPIGDGGENLWGKFSDFYRRQVIKHVRAYHQTMMASKTTNFKYVHRTRRRENPENTMTKSMFATDKVASAPVFAVAVILSWDGFSEGLHRLVTKFH